MDMTPSGLARIAGVILAMAAIILHFSPYGASTSWGFWMMGLAYLISALFAAAMIDLNPQPLPPRR